MSRRIVVGPADSLELGVPIQVDNGEEPICVVRCASGVFAIADTCSHEDFSLADGEVDTDRCEIECWRHGSFFSLATGAALSLPATMPVATYPVELHDGVIEVVVE